MKNIILIAPPAAGKGTLAEMLVEKYPVVHISTGDMLREVAKRNDEIGSYVVEMLSRGELIKDEIIYQLLEDRLLQPDCENGYILDGFPRNVDQAIEYDKILTKLNKDIGYVIVIDIEKDILKQRITGRRICKNCNAIFNINSKEKRPLKESVCDNCGGPLYQRSDDNLEAFEHRYQTFLEKAKPLLDYYQAKGVLYHINGNGTKTALLEAAEQVLSEGK